MVTKTTKKHQLYDNNVDIDNHNDIETSIKSRQRRHKNLNKPR